MTSAVREHSWKSVGQRTELIIPTTELILPPENADQRDEAGVHSGLEVFHRFSPNVFKISHNLSKKCQKCWFGCCQLELH